jgi:hypothetical protein
MIKKILQTTTGEKIHIYDDVYPAHCFLKFHEFIEKSHYVTGGRSSTIEQGLKDNFLQCIFSEEDLENLSIMNREETKKILLEHNLEKPDRYWGLLSTHMSQYQYHVDNYAERNKTFLYYANCEWNKNWGGETLFCNNKGELEIAVEFKPNRVVVFDNHIEHKSASLSLISYPYRFIFTAQFLKYK